jgi:hypothetical protein
VNQNRATRGLLVAGLSVLLAACGSGVTISAAAPSASPGAIPTASATPAIATPGPTPASSASFGTWSGLRWETPALTAPYETVADVVAFAGGYVAVGQLQTEHGNEAAVWTSPDWRSWTRTFLDVPAAGDSTLWYVLPAGSGLVAIGSSGVQHCVPPPGEGQVCDPLPIGVWTSADGRTWRQTPMPTTFAAATIASVAAGPSRLVLVGDTGWDKPAIWTSTDGVAWHRETLASAMFTKAHLRGITAARGGWVLTGFVGGSKPICCVSGPSASTPAAWFSPDGMRWQAARVDGTKQAIGDGIGRLFVGRDGLVAWGVGDKSSSGWTSPDGRRWSPRPPSDGTPVIPWASDGQRIIGESFAGHNDLALWVSTDGTAWEPLTATGAVDQMPGWSGPGVSADAAFVFPTGVGFIGQNGTDRDPLWFAVAVGGP